jgi:hypothetical protein
MTTTFNDLIQKTSRRLEPLGISETVVLQSNILAGATTIPVTDPSSLIGSIQPGKTLGIDLEVFYVQSVTGTTITVVPGWQGSTEAPHSANAVVFINPRFSYFDIGTAINDDLLDLSSPENGLYQVKSVEITFNPSIVGYDLVGVASINEIISIRYQVPYPIGVWKPLHYGEWELTPASDPTAFPSGFALTLYRDCYPGLPFRVTYAAPFGQFVNLTDDATNVAGLSSTMFDIPPMGAMVGLVAPREVKRNQIDSEPDSRRGPEVPPGSVMNSVAGVLRQRQARINSESARLQQLYGSQQR